MRDRARPIVTLLISPDSPLAQGRLPRGASQEEDGIQACFDPVSYGALRASLGEFIPLKDIQTLFEETVEQHRKGDLKEHPGGGDHEECCL